MKLYLKELENGQISKIRYTEINNAYSKIDSDMRTIGKLGKSFSQTLSEGMKKFSSWTSSAFIVMKFVQETKNGVRSIYDLDTALVDLRKTANMTANQLDSFYYKSNDVAKQMGVTTKEIISQASAWSRLGFSTAEAATQMAKYSSWFKLISPGMDTDTSTTSLVSIMKAYDIDVNNVLDGIMSKINDVGNKFATSNTEIAEGLQNSSAAMAAVGGTLEDNIALFVGAQEIVQNASLVGNAIRSISLRIRGFDEETEELSDDLIGVTGKIADLTKVASNNNRGISLFKDSTQTEYKSLVQYLGEVSDIWDELDQKTQNDLLNNLFGKNRAQVGAAIIKNFDAVKDSIEVMQNSAGSAERELSTVMDSMEYKLNRFKETGVGIAQNLFNREDMKSVIDFFNALAEGIDFATDKLGLFNSIGIGAGIFTSIKNVG